MVQTEDTKELCLIVLHKVCIPPFKCKLPVAAALKIEYKFLNLENKKYILGIKDKNISSFEFYEAIYILLVVNCGDPGTVINARRTGNDFRMGQQVTYACNNCYFGGGTITCQANGRWTNLPTCSGKSKYIFQNFSKAENIRIQNGLFFIVFQYHCVTSCLHVTFLAHYCLALCQLIMNRMAFKLNICSRNKDLRK